MNAVTLRTFCAAAIFFGALLMLAPESGGKRIASACASCALLLMLVSIVKETDLSDYSLKLAEYRAAADSIKEDAQTHADAMNRLVIERGCEEYILDKAAELGVGVSAVKVSAHWSREGVWVPYKTVVYLCAADEDTQILSMLIEAELGVGVSEQEWIIE